MDKKQCNSCGKPKCSCKNKEFTKAVIEVDNPEQITLMRRVVIPASMGDDTAVPPVVGKYHNVLLYYEANHKSYLYSSDGIPTLLANGLTDYEQAVNLPEINGHKLLGNQTGPELDLQNTLSVVPDTGLKLENDELSGIPTTDTTIGMVKPGDGLEVDTDGTLSISDIEQYAHFFDTVTDMKAATDLVAGDYARTLGFHTINDGGGATYKITNSGIANEMDIIAVGSSLYAEVIYPTVMNPEILGAYGDGSHDDTNVLQYLFNYKNIEMTKTYLVSSTLQFKDKEYFYLNAKNSTITYTGTSYAVLLQHLRFGTVEFGNITASNGSGVLMNSVVGVADRIAYINLSFNKLSCQETNIGVNIENEGFINEINVTGGQISSGDYGFHFVNSNTVSSGCNAWRINHVGFEGCDTCFYYNASNAGRFYGHDIKNSRYIEHTTSTILHVIGAFYRCTFESWGLLKLSRLDLTNANLTDFKFKGYIYDESGTNLLYTGFYHSNNIRTYFNDRYFKESLTTTNNVSSGAITVHKNGNLVMVKFGDVVVTGTTTLTVVDEGGNPYPPLSSSFMSNVRGAIVSNDGEAAAYALVRADGSIAIKCTDSSKAYAGILTYITDVYAYS